MRSSLFWDVKQSWLVGTDVSEQLVIPQNVGNAFQDWLALEYGNDSLPETSVKTVKDCLLQMEEMFSPETSVLYQSTLHNIPEQKRPK